MDYLSFYGYEVNIHLYVCMHTLYVCTYTWERAYVDVRVLAWVCVCTRARTSKCMWVCELVIVSMRACALCVPLCVRAHIHTKNIYSYTLFTYVYIYIYVNTFINTYTCAANIIQYKTYKKIINIQYSLQGTVKAHQTIPYKFPPPHTHAKRFFSQQYTDICFRRYVSCYIHYQLL